VIEHENARNNEHRAMFLRVERHFRPLREVFAGARPSALVGVYHIYLLGLAPQPLFSSYLGQIATVLDVLRCAIELSYDTNDIYRFTSAGTRGEAYIRATYFHVEHP